MYLLHSGEKSSFFPVTSTRRRFSNLGVQKIKANVILLEMRNCETI